MGTSRNIRKKNKLQNNVDSSVKNNTNLGLNLFIILYLKKYKTIIISSISIIFIYILVSNYMTYHKNVKYEQVNSLILEKKFEDLDKLSPVLFELFNVSKDLKDTSLNGELYDYKRIINSDSKKDLELYVSNNENLFIDIIIFKLSYIYIEEKNFNKAKSLLKNISSENVLYTLKLQLISQINLIKKIEESK